MRQMSKSCPRLNDASSGASRHRRTPDLWKTRYRRHVTFLRQASTSAWPVELITDSARSDLERLVAADPLVNAVVASRLAAYRTLEPARFGGGRSASAPTALSPPRSTAATCCRSAATAALGRARRAPRPARPALHVHRRDAPRRSRRCGRCSSRPGARPAPSATTSRCSCSTAASSACSPISACA